MDIVDAIALKIKNNLPYKKIEELTGIPHSTIHKKYQDIIELFDPDKIERYEEQKGTILSGVERVLVEQMLDKGKLKEASLNNTAYAYNTVFQANRLHRGQSSEIVEVRELSMSFSEALQVVKDRNNDNNQI